MAHLLASPSGSSIGDSHATAPVASSNGEGRALVPPRPSTRSAESTSSRQSRGVLHGLGVPAPELLQQWQDDFMFGQAVAQMDAVLPLLQPSGSRADGGVGDASPQLPRVAINREGSGDESVTTVQAADSSDLTSIQPAVAAAATVGKPHRRPAAAAHRSTESKTSDVSAEDFVGDLAGEAGSISVASRARQR